MNSMTTAIIYPDEIRVSGLPFYLRGWNRTFKRTEEMSEGTPVYRLEPYTIFLVIRVLGVSIRKFSGRWYLMRDCDGEAYSNIYKDSRDQIYPFGQWSRGVFVE